MTDKPNNHTSGKDALLNKLIRAAREKETVERFVRPDSYAITAYLMGTATKKQEKAVIAALLQSEDFRREILQMAQEMDELENIELPIQEKIAVPDRREFLKKHEETVVTLIERVSFWVRLKEFWVKLLELKIPQVYAPAVATLVLVFLIIQTGIFAPHKKQPPLLAQFSVYSENIESGLLVSNITRSVESQKTYPTPDEAALAEFSFLLKFEGGSFQLNPPQERPKPPSLSRGVVLQLLDLKNKIIREFSTDLPITEAGSAEPVIAWALGLPARNLYNVEMKSGIMQVKWKEDMGSYGCVTFTYRDKDDYRAVVGFIFDLR